MIDRRSFLRGAAAAVVGVIVRPKAVAEDEAMAKLIASFDEMWYIGEGVQEVLSFDRILSEKEMNDVGHYLAQKYGLEWQEQGGFWKERPDPIL